MTDPNNFGFDSLLQDLGVPVEIHQNPVVADEPADPEPVVSVTEAVSVTTEEAAAAVIEAADEGASEGSRDDRRRRRRRRRRGPGQDESGFDGGEGESADHEEGSPAVAVADADSEDEEDEPFEVEDLTNLQFPSWDELIGSLHRPHH
jgi:ribonuclease E